MFKQFFQAPNTISRYLNAPLLEDRLRYLDFRAKQGTTRSVLREIATYQLIIIKYLRLEENRTLVLEEINSSADQWADDTNQNYHCKDYTCSSSKGRFTLYAVQWLRFLNRLETQPAPVPTQITKFIDFMRNEKGLSETTIIDSYRVLKRFFNQIKGNPDQFLGSLTATDLDNIQIREFRQGNYARCTIKGICSILRNFFRYAERQGWCCSGIADSITSPRIYTHETLPAGPSLEEVQRLLKATEGNSPGDIRARAVILLLAVYGFRDSEVRQLRLEDINWEQGIICLKHSKRGPVQQFPLTQIVGWALARYIKEVRPRCSIHREVFLTIHAPFRPLKCLDNLLYVYWKRLGIDCKGHGPHSLRHACATRLINQGVPLKTIADQLGHRSLEATRIYAKVDLIRLREVTSLTLGGVL